MMTHIHWTSKRYTKIVISARTCHSTCNSTWCGAIYFIFTRLARISESRRLVSWSSEWTSGLWWWRRRKSRSLTSRRPGSSDRSQCRTECSRYFCRIFFESRIITFNGFQTPVSVTIVYRVNPMDIALETDPRIWGKVSNASQLSIWSTSPLCWFLLLLVLSNESPVLEFLEFPFWLGGGSSGIVYE